MTAPIAPQAPAGRFEEMSALANELAQYITAHPSDTVARGHMKWLAGQLRHEAPIASAGDNPPEPSAGRQVASGLAGAGVDLVKGAAQSVMHPIQTLGQLSGVGNWDKWGAAKHDPNASFAEKLDAWIRATPFNAGYAPARSFLESTGMKSDTPAPLSDQTRQGADLAASLLMMRYGVPGAKRAGRMVNALTGGRAARALEAARNPGAAEVSEPPQAAIQRELSAGARPEPPVSLDALRAIRDFEAGKISGEDLRAAMDQAAGRAIEEPRTPRVTKPPASPLEQTPAERGVTEEARAARVSAKEAARRAYNFAISHGQTVEQAKAAARRAAGHAGRISVRTWHGAVRAHAEEYA